MGVWTDDLHLKFSVLSVSVLYTETIIIGEYWSTPIGNSSVLPLHMMVVPDL